MWYQDKTDKRNLPRWYTDKTLEVWCRSKCGISMKCSYCVPCMDIKCGGYMIIKN